MEEYIQNIEEIQQKIKRRDVQWLIIRLLCSYLFVRGTVYLLLGKIPEKTTTLGGMILLILASSMAVFFIVGVIQIVMILWDRIIYLEKLTLCGIFCCVIMLVIFYSVGFRPEKIGIAVLAAVMAVIIYIIEAILFCVLRYNYIEDLFLLEIEAQKLKSYIVRYIDTLERSNNKVDAYYELNKSIIELGDKLGKKRKAMTRVERFEDQNGAPKIPRFDLSGIGMFSIVDKARYRKIMSANCRKLEKAINKMTEQIECIDLVLSKKEAIISELLKMSENADDPYQSESAKAHCMETVVTKYSNLQKRSKLEKKKIKTIKLWRNWK